MVQQRATRYRPTMDDVRCPRSGGTERERGASTRRKKEGEKSSLCLRFRIPRRREPPRFFRRDSHRPAAPSFSHSESFFRPCSEDFLLLADTRTRKKHGGFVLLLNVICVPYQRLIFSSVTRAKTWVNETWSVSYRVCELVLVVGCCCWRCLCWCREVVTSSSSSMIARTHKNGGNEKREEIPHRRRRSMWSAAKNLSHFGGVSLSWRSPPGWGAPSLGGSSCDVSLGNDTSAITPTIRERVVRSYA